MFKKRLGKADLEELKKRAELINSYRLVVGALEVQKNIYLNQILPKYGCDMNKRYKIDFLSGIIKEDSKK